MPAEGCCRARRGLRVLVWAQVAIPYDIPAGVNPRFDEIKAAGCEVEVGEDLPRGGSSADGFPQVHHWCEISCPDGRKVSGSGNTAEEAFRWAAERLGQLT